MKNPLTTELERETYMTTIASSAVAQKRPQQIYRRKPGLFRKTVYAIARLGWGLIGDMGTLLRIAAGIVIVGAPLFLARFLTEHSAIGAMAPNNRIRLVYLLAAQGIALMVSGWILMRLYLRKPKDRP